LEVKNDDRELADESIFGEKLGCIVVMKWLVYIVELRFGGWAL